MTHRKDWLTDYQKIDRGKVILGDNRICQVEGIGIVSFKMFDGIVRKLKNVKYVPRMSRNLISISVLDDLGYTCKVEKGIKKIYRGSMVVIKGKKEDGLYHLIGETVTGLTTVAIVPKNEKANLWHKRLGHISDKGLQILVKDNLFGKDKVSKVDFCKHCILGKQHRVHFKASSHKSKSVLEQVHSDLWGPERTATHGGNLYFLSIVDDFSRKVWVYLLKTKDEAFDKFK